MVKTAARPLTEPRGEASPLQEILKHWTFFLFCSIVTAHDNGVIHKALKLRPNRGAWSFVYGAFFVHKTAEYKE